MTKMASSFPYYDDEIFSINNKDIGNYSVSNYGKVVCRRTTHPLQKSYQQNPIKPKVLRDYTVAYCFDIKGETFIISTHYLVCKAFNPNPLKLNHIQHIDGDIRNNTANNLKWTNDTENSTAITLSVWCPTTKKYKNIN